LPFLLLFSGRLVGPIDSRFSLNGLFNFLGSLLRKKYTQEFKEAAVKLITEQGHQITEAARNLGLNENMLRRWKRQIEGAKEGTQVTQNGSAMLAELNRLRKENKRLIMERENLIKSAAFFTKEMG
jgi:transposase